MSKISKLVLVRHLAVRLGLAATLIGVVLASNPARAQSSTPAATADAAQGGFVFGGKFAGVQIYRANSDGSHSKALTTGDQSDFPVWSSDGTQIAYTAFNLTTSMAQIIVMDADGTNPHPLTDAALNAFSGAWSSDGKQFVFYVLPPKATSLNGGSLYVMAADGSHPTKILDDGGTVLNWFPSWTPDGKRIIFSSDRGGGKVYQIYTINPDGTDIQALTDDKTDTGTATDRVLPLVSPDGKQIVFLAGKLNFQVAEGGKYDVYVMNADGSNVRQLTTVNNVVLGLAWSPDGKQIAYLAGSGQKIHLYVMDADGSNPATITTSNVILQSVGLSWFEPGK